MIFRSLWHDRRINAAVLLGVLCAAAVLTGALLVGDSMRGSLRALTLDRLGRIDTVLQGTSFFEPPVEFIEGDLPEPWAEAMPAILLPASVEFGGRICQTQILACRWFDNPIDRPVLSFKFKRKEGMVVNRALADKLKVQMDDTISLRLYSPQNIPPESSLGRRNDLVLRSRIKIGKVIKNNFHGRFSLKSDQQAEPLLIVPLEWLQNRLNVDGKINAVFFMTQVADPFLEKSDEMVSTSEQRAELEKRFKPSATDLGIDVDHRYVKSARMMFTKPQAEAIEKAWPEARPGLLYLATSIKASKNGRETPYSTVFAFDLDKEAETSVSAPTPKPAPDREDLRPRLFLNRWTADDLAVEIGDEIELAWLAPENVNETKSKIFRLEGILPMEGFGADPLLVPEVKGFTDEAAIADWDPPFPFDAKKIRKKDEDYWDAHRAAPKAFVPLEVGQQLWGSRFGDVTTFILPKSNQEKSPGRESGGIANLSPSLFGLSFLPVKEQGLAASAGTTPFSVLFLSFSFFIIASALMLVMLLSRLSVEMKARQIGIRLATGWTRRQIARLLLAEGFVIATIGSLLGVGFGVHYARLMVHGLTTWWVDAVTVPFLKFHISPTSLVIGFLGGVVLSCLTILWTLRIVRKVSVKSLLDGDIVQMRINVRSDSAIHPKDPSSRPGCTLVEILTFISIAGMFAGLGNGSPVFYFVGAAVLLALGLLRFAVIDFHPAGFFAVRSLADFARSNAVRNRSRSLLCVGLVASTTFLVLSIGAFRLDPQDRYKGGIAYMAETAFPVYHDIGTREGREQLGIQVADERYLEERQSEIEKILAFRVLDGDSASCLNLYQAGQPRILGAPEAIIERSRFSFAKKTKPLPEEKNVWSALWRPISIDPDGIRRVPVVMDANTAMYALHLYGGVGEVYELKTDDETIRCEIVGLLGNSILQGEIVMSEKHFLDLFPEVDGYRYFLFDVWGHMTTGDLSDRTIKIFYDLLDDYGFQGEPTADRLRKLFAVQNTYLSTFQSLGGIGLLLGVFGLAVIQLRNVFERRKELALMQAVGFTKSRIILLQLYESFSLLMKGLGLVVLASAIALLPFWLGFAAQEVSLMSAIVQFVWLVGGMVLVGLVSNVAASLAVLRIPVARELAEER